MPLAPEYSILNHDNFSVNLPREAVVVVMTTWWQLSQVSYQRQTNEITGLVGHD